MTESAGGNGVQVTPGPAVRVWRAMRALRREQRLCGLAALALFVAMFLPWFGEKGITSSKPALVVSLSLSAFDVFGLTEIVVLLVSLGVLVLLFVRGEGRVSRSPGSDGALICAGGGLSALLILYRLFAKPSSGQASVSVGIGWGIFLALVAAAWLTSSGLALRRAERGATPANSGGTPATERRLTRRERSGTGDPPKDARWVDPAAARTPEPARNPARNPARDQRDSTQLSLELPHDHFDE